MGPRLVMTIVSLIAFFMVGCGVPQEEYDATQYNLASCQATLKSNKKAFKNCERERNAAHNRLRALGEDVSGLEGKLSDTRAELERIKRANELRQRAMEELLAKFAGLIRSGRLTIGVNDGRMVIQLSSNVLFKLGQSRLSRDGKEAVAEVGEVLQTIEERKFQVAGHTDNTRGRGRVNPNWTLSYMRARAVFDVLIENSMDESMLSLAAYAEYSPVASNDTSEGQEENRRIEIVLLPTSDELPLRQLKKIERVKEKIRTHE